MNRFSIRTKLDGEHTKILGTLKLDKFTLTALKLKGGEINQEAFNAIVAEVGTGFAKELAQALEAADGS